MELTSAANAAEISGTSIDIDAPAAITTPEREMNRDRLALVFERCADGLFRYLLLRVGMNAHAAEDLIQQVCYEAARKQRMPEGDDACEAWLFGIARNRIRKYWRWHWRKDGRRECDRGAVARELLAGLERGPLPGELLSRKESSEQLMLAVTELPAADQQLLFAFYFDGRSSQEIAVQIGTTAKSVESRLYRIRCKLRALLGDKEKGIP